MKQLICHINAAAGNTKPEVIALNHVHLCLSDLIDQDLSAYEYYQTLSSKVQALLAGREISTLEELQDNVNRIKESALYQ